MLSDKAIKGPFRRLICAVLKSFRKAAANGNNPHVCFEFGCSIWANTPSHKSGNNPSSIAAILSSGSVSTIVKQLTEHYSEIVCRVFAEFKANLTKPVSHPFNNQSASLISLPFVVKRVRSVGSMRIVIAQWNGPDVLLAVELRNAHI